MDTSTKETLVVTGCALGLLPVLSGWVTSYTELRDKYGWRSFCCPELRFGLTTLLMGGLMYKMLKR
jgi:hypothetical protein